MRRMKYLLFLLVLLCSFYNVFAKENSFTISSLILKDKSENVLENDSPIIDSSNIKYDLVFYDTGDYVTYNIKIKNNTDTHYIINDVFDNNSNSAVKYEYIISDKDFDKGEKQTIQMKVIYKNEIPSDSVLENSSYHLDDNITISIDLIEYDLYYILNPKTNQNAIFFYIIFVVLIAFIITIIKKKKLVLSIIILLILLGTYKVTAKDRELFEISLNNKVEIPIRFIRNDWRDSITDSYNKIVVSKSVDIPNNAIDISERGDGSIKGWIDSNGTLYFGSKYRMYLPSNSTAFFDKVYTVISIEFEKDSISSIFTQRFDGMFSGLSEITELDSSWINTNNATSINGMFSGCSKLKKLNLHGWTNPNISHIFSIVSGCNALEELDLSNWDNHKVSSFSFSSFSMKNSSKLNLDYFDISSISNISGMFSGCSGFDIDLSTWDFSHVTQAGGMFGGCRAETLNFGDANFSNLVGVSGMLSGSNFEKIYFGDVNFSNLISMSGMFAGSTAEVIEFGNVIGNSFEAIDGMFSSVPKLKKIDLSMFDFSNVSNYSYLFADCDSLVEIILPSALPDGCNIELPNMFNYNGNDISEINNSIPSKAKITISNNYSTFVLGQTFNIKIKKLAGDSNPTVSTANNNIQYIRRSDTAPNMDTMTEDNLVSIIDEKPIYAWFNNGTINYYCADTTIYLNSNISYMFSYLKSLKEVDFTNVNTSFVRYASNAFDRAGYDSQTFNLDLSNWDTSNIISMSKMFNNAGFNATEWSIGDLSNWDTSNVTDMSNMFYMNGDDNTCNAKMQSFDIGNLGNWNTSKVTDMGFIFSCAGSAATTWNVGDLSNWDVSKVYRMMAMFQSVGQNSSNWSIGDLSNWDVSNAEYLYSMFASSGYNSTVWSIGDLSNWDTSKVRDMHRMFSYAGRNSTTWESIGTLKVRGSDISNLFNSIPKAKATIKIYDKPSKYTNAFASSATSTGSLITVDYKSNVTNIDNIIATKSSSSNVVKGNLFS